MASWVKMGTNLEAHPKVALVRSTMGWDSDQIIARLYRLWSTVREHAPDGSLESYADDEVAVMTGCPFQDCERFIAVMLKVRLLERDERGKLLVHDWMEHNGDHIKAARRMTEYRRRKTARNGNVTEPCRHVHGEQEQEQEPEPSQASPSRESEPIPFAQPAVGRGVDGMNGHTNGTPPDRKPRTPRPPEPRIDFNGQSLTWDEWFDDFWRDYPRKVGRVKARKAWRALPKEVRTSATIARMAESLGVRLASEKWAREPEFIPHPTTYINQRRWEDEDL